MIANYQEFIISNQKSVKEAIKKIEKNKQGIVFVCSNDSRKIIGSLTDGDVRRGFISGFSLNDKVEVFCQPKFISASGSDSREYILKLLDGAIRVVPIVDQYGHLCDIVTKKNFPIKGEKDVLFKARSPVRISFSGGGTDMTHFFMEDFPSAVINATITLYARATLEKTLDEKIVIQSTDLGEEVRVGSIDELKDHPKFMLFWAALKVIEPRPGFRLHLKSDFPIGSGLGGSSAVLSSIFGVFNLMREDCWTNHELAELVFQAERIYLMQEGGWQDQYATVFGGFNYLEFSKNENVVHPLRLAHKSVLELEDSLVLVYSGESHESGEIQKNLRQSPAQSKEINSKKMFELTQKMKLSILKEKNNELGKILNQLWELKKEINPASTNELIDSIYELGIRAGALGGKVLGAGSGGFFLFYVSEEKRLSFDRTFKEKGFNVLPVNFDFAGLQSWKIRK